MHERDHDDDVDLLRRVRAGEREAVAEFVERMRCIPRIMNAKNERAGRPLAAEDLADASQQVFALVWQKLGDFRGEAALETWVFPFCTLTWLSASRGRGRHAAAPIAEDVARRDEHAHLVEPLDGGRVIEALAKIPADESAVVRLKQLEELTFEEIGAQLSISPNTAKSRYYRGLEALRQKLRGFAPGADG